VAEDSSDPDFTNNPNAAARRGLIPNVLNASGSAPMYACRAWVNFNGTGTVAIRASGNVSSITDNGTGDYTINFATDMEDANYCVTGSTQRVTTGQAGGFGVKNSSIAVGSVGVLTSNGFGGLEDASTVSVAIFR
jgi:hypothetical protein